MISTDLISFIKSQTAVLSRIAGEMIVVARDQEQELLVQAKQIAKTMAIEMNMREGLEDWPCTERLSTEQVHKFQTTVGALLKASEVIDKDDHPYKRMVMSSIRVILNL